MLRMAATLLALLAALPAVTPLLGGYKAFTNECGRNLTHLGPSRKWPEFPARTYNYTGLLVMPEDVCSGTLVTAKFMLSTSLCRLWKGNVDFENDIEEDGSEVRIGIIQGDVPRHLCQRQLVTRYLHFEKVKPKLMRNPVMLVEVEREFPGWTSEMLPGIYRKTPLSSYPKTPGKYLVFDVVGYENSANLDIYHQSIFDARAWPYNPAIHKYGRKRWDLSQAALCTFDVSPVRTVCGIDRGAPLMSKKNIGGIVLGIVDDMETPGNNCGEGRVHYNIFMALESKFSDWIYRETDGMVTIMELVDGKPIQVHPVNNHPETTTARRPGHHRPKPTTTTRRPREKSGSGRQMVSLSPLLLSVAVTIVHLVFQY